MNSTGNAFNRNTSRVHAPRHKSKGPVRDGPRSFLSAGSIRYERTLGRLKAAARDKGIHPDTVIMGGKATFAKWLCDTCGHQCITSKDYQNHLMSRKHIEAIEGHSDGEILEMQSKLLEDAFLSRLKTARTVSTKATILYEDIQNAAKKASLDDTKWANEADPLTAFLEEMEREGKMTLIREENGIYLKFRPPTAPPVKVAPLQYSDEQIVSRQIKLAKTAEQREASVPEVEADTLERTEGAPKISFAITKKLDPKLGVQAAEESKQAATAEEEDEDSNEEEQRVKKKSRLEDGINERGDEDEQSSSCGRESSSGNDGCVRNSSSSSGTSSSRSDSSSSSRSKSSNDSGTKSEKPLSNRKGGSHIVFKAAQETAKSTITAHCWLTRKLVVKCVCKATKKVGYYKQKGEVVDVLDYWKVDGCASADIKMADGVILSKVPMKDLETVLPALGRSVIIVQTADELIRGQEAELLSINEEAFSCSVRILSGNRVGTKLVGLPYESVCKVNS